MLPFSWCVPVVFLFTEVTDKMSHACAVKVESTNQPCRVAAQDRDMSPPPSGGDEATSEQVTVKQEKPEEEMDGSACCSVSVKVEDFSPECMLAAQSKMLEEWKPEGLHIQNRDSNARVSCTRLAQGKKGNDEGLKQTSVVSDEVRFTGLGLITMCLFEMKWYKSSK